MTPLILASKSPSRRALLSGAGISFEAVGSDVDEAVIKKRELSAGRTPSEVALILAEAKALAVDAPLDALVIGGDQVLEFDGQLYDKPTSIVEAAERLHAMVGKSHYLRGGLVLAKAGEIVWRHQSSATLTMRECRRDEIDAYLESVGERVLGTVGAYELEGRGVRLFSAIDGDYFTILGLSLLPLLTELRARGALPW